MTRQEIGHSLKAASVRRELEASLRRLRVDVIDLYQIHWPDPEPEMEDGWQTLAQLQKEGKVRYIGVSNFNVAQMKQVARIAPITSLQPNYNIVTPPSLLIENASDRHPRSPPQESVPRRFRSRIATIRD
jgi:aryl-alcohol dehydrogenase-like predicted oxidoreductase